MIAEPHGLDAAMIDQLFYELENADSMFCPLDSSPKHATILELDGDLLVITVEGLEDIRVPAPRPVVISEDVRSSPATVRTQNVRRTLQIQRATSEHGYEYSIRTTITHLNDDGSERSVIEVRSGLQGKVARLCMEYGCAVMAAVANQRRASDTKKHRR